MGRHRIDYHWLYNAGRIVQSSNNEDVDTLRRWELMYRTPYSEMVGARIKRTRTSRDLTQGRLAERVRRPRGGTYTKGFLSRVEKGYASSPLYAYVHIAEALELEPGRLMGSDETQKPLSEAEMTLVRFTRRVGIKPDEAIARLARDD
jgi:transcriptional regulator with XRE-family HTH domain